MPFKTAKQDESLQQLVPRSWEIFVCWLEPNPGQPYSSLIVKSGDSHWEIDPSGGVVEISLDSYRHHWSEMFKYELERK